MTTTASPAAQTMAYTQELTCALSVRDLQASRRFYADVLGFTFLYEMTEIGWCELATPLPGVNVGLSQVEHPQTAGGAVLTFDVDDIDAARAHLEEHDVRFDGPTQDVAGMVRLATFYDLDGNAFMLSQTLRQP